MLQYLLDIFQGSIPEFRFTPSLCDLSSCGAQPQDRDRTRIMLKLRNIPAHKHKQMLIICTVVTRITAQKCSVPESDDTTVGLTKIVSKSIPASRDYQQELVHFFRHGVGVQSVPKYGLLEIGFAD